MNQLHTIGLITLSLLLLGCSGENTKDASAAVTKKAVETTKSIFTGIDEGLETGRKAAESIDGATVVGTKEEFEAHLSAEVLKAQFGATENTVLLIVGFENKGDTPIRVMDLSAPTNLMILDKEGYAASYYITPTDFTVPARAKIKARFTFTGTPENVSVFRIHNIDYEIGEDNVDMTPRPKQESKSQPVG